MKYKKTVRLAVTVFGWLVAAMIATSARAQVFKCGSDLLTYYVVSNVHIPGSGVRCVKYHATGPGNLIWYGEGQWQGRTYRHVGIAFFDHSEVNRAADITGNGEDFNNSVTGLVFQIQGSWPEPNTIIVTGAWNERWLLRREGVAYRPLPRPSRCGANFVHYDVGRGRNPKPPRGLRCSLRISGNAILDEGSPPITTAWFGNGAWDGRTYSHLGRVRIDRARGISGTGDASDICDFRFGESCNSTPPGSLQFSRWFDANNPQGDLGYNVNGAWPREVWTAKDESDNP
jgi:hypothetical protein